MTDLTAIVNKLTTDLVNVSPQKFAQVITAAPGGFDVPVDSGAELYSLLGSLVSNKFFPLTPKDNEDLDHIIYTLVGVDALELEGYRITQTDRYILSLRTATYANLVTLLNNVITTIRTSAYTIEPIDYQMQHEPEYTTDGAFRCDVEIEFTYAVDDAGGPSSPLATDLPMAIVYPVGRFADEPDDMIGIHQRLIEQYGIVVATINDDMAARLEDVMTSLLGFTQGSGYNEVEYVRGSNLGGVGTMQVWREVYQDWHYIEDAYT